MNRKDLGQIYYINREIEDIKERLAELQSDYLRATKLSQDVVQTSGTSDRVGNLACAMADLQTLYSIKLQELYLKKSQVERFISGIDDAEVRLIFRLRHINCLEWSEIAAEINYSERHARRKYSIQLNMSDNVR